MRVWSLRRFPGSNWAKAMRDIRSPPKTACGLRLDTEASCSPDSSSISVVTTLVVPTSMARPNFRSAVSPGSTARIRPPKLVTVTSPSRSRSAAGSVLSTSRRHGVGRAADGGEQLLEIRRLVMLLLWQRDLDDALGDAGVDSHRRRRAQPAVRRRGSGRSARRAGGATCTVIGLGHPALAGEAVALADERVAELQLVHDRRRRHGARDELDPAGRAAPPAPAGGRDVDAGIMGGLEDGRSGLDVEDALVGKDGERWAHSCVRIPLPA